MKTMLTLGLGALALAATAHALPCDGKCDKPCGAVAHVKDAVHAAPAAVAAGAPHAAHAAAAPHAVCAPHAPLAAVAPQTTVAAAAPLALAAPSPAGGSCQAASVAQAPSCTTASGRTAVAVAPAGSTCRTRTDELAAAIDAAVGVAPARTGATIAASPAPAPRPAALAGGAVVAQRDQRSLEARVAELERELARRAAPEAPATTLRSSSAAFPSPPVPPQVIHVPRPYGATLHEEDEDAEDVEVRVEDGDEPFGIVLEHDGDGAPQVRWLGASDDDCDAEEEDVFVLEGNRVLFASADGKNRFEVRSHDDGDGAVRIEIVSPDGRTVHRERTRAGDVEIVRPGARVEALAERLRERGRLSDDERRELVERVQGEVERAREQGRIAREQGERAREEAGRMHERAERIAARAREQAQRRHAPVERFRVVRPDRPDRDDAGGEALREVHELMREMRAEIEGLREELRDMRRELRGAQRDALFEGADETIR